MRWFKSALERLVCLQFILATWYTGLDASSILMSGLFGEGSHFLSLIPIGESLVRQGHEVTFLISKEYAHRADDPKLSKLFRFEVFSLSDPNYSTEVYFRTLEEIAFSGSGGMYAFFQTFSEYNRVLIKTCESVLSDKGMMNRFESIDVIVTDMGWPCGAIIKMHLLKHSNIDVRLVYTTPTTPHAVVFAAAGSPYNAAYMPVIMSGLSSSMSFLERTKNLLLLLSLRIFTGLMENNFHAMCEQFDLHDEAHELLTIADLVLTSCDFAVEFPFPATPNIIPVGGLTARPAEPLPKDLEEFMSSSGDHGVIIFSLGSYFSAFISSRHELLGELLDAFRRVPQKVIMQLKTLPADIELPPNVKTMPWLPQNDLMGHPKTRMFMFHGGNNGFYEGIYHGVPMIIMPFLGDQVDTAARVETRKIGLRIEKELVKADYIHDHLSLVLGNATMTENARRLSAIMRNRPMAPADRAAFWINHVTEFGGQYMRAPVHELSFIQYYLIDVFALLSVVCITLIFIMYRLGKALVSCCLRCVRQSKSKRD